MGAQKETWSTDRRLLAGWLAGLVASTGTIGEETTGIVGVGVGVDSSNVPKFLVKPHWFRYAGLRDAVMKFNFTAYFPSLHFPPHG